MKSTEGNMSKKKKLVILIKMAKANFINFAKMLLKMVNSIKNVSLHTYLPNIKT